jgi:hypothetical protein
LYLRKLLILSVSIFILTAATSTAQASDSSVNRMRDGVNWQREQTWHWQSIALVKNTRTRYAEKQTRSRPYLHWLARTWNNRRAAAKKHANNPPHYNEWICIHRYEGSWNDPNAPYYGGLQMDISFQRAHGWDALQKWGTADNWHPLTQMWVAERAFSSGRGFYPWPNTARYCGLI